MKIIVIIATYNERENIETLIPKVLELNNDIRVLVVDDASPDGTGELAEQMAKETGRVKVFHRSGKLGLGTALKTGMKIALDDGADLVATMDADHSHAPVYLGGMIEKAKDAAIVVGSRYVPGGGVRGWGLKRVMLSRMANLYARTVTGLNVNDCTTGYRTYSRDFLSSINIDNIEAKGYSFLVEILLLAQKNGFKIAEQPIIFTDRVIGESKINLNEITGGAWNLLKVRMKLKNGG